MKRLVSTFALGFALVATTANAQTSPVEDGAAPAQADGEIIVTAQRREERLRDVPIAITAVSSERLQSAHITDVAELTYVSPSINIVSAQGQVKPFLRGIGSQGAIAGIEQPIALYQDGVYIAAANFPIFGFTDIQRVEIIKGPQGTLFGRNALGGLISVTSRDPRDVFEASAAASIGTYETYEATAFVGGPLGEGVRASVYGRFGKQNKGFGTNLTTGLGTYTINHDISLRGKLIFEPGPNTTIRISGDYVDRDGSLNTIRYFGARSALNATPIGAYDTNTNLQAYLHSKGGGGQVQLDQDFGSIGFTSLTAYRKSRGDYGVDVDLSPLSVLQVAPITQKDKQFSQELQLHSNGKQTIQWIAGLFYFDAKADLDQFTRFGPPIFGLPTSPSTRSIIARSTTKSYAAFGQLDAHLTERTTVTAGLRYTIESRGFTANQTVVLRNGVVVAPSFRPVDLDYKKLTWRLSVKQDLSDNANVYASFNRGFKSGGFNPAVPADPSYLPEQLDAYEFGLKSVFADGKGTFDAAGFYYDYSNMQVSTFQNGSTTIYNGAKARIWGAEASLGFAVTPSLKLNADVSYLNTRFTNFTNGVRGVLQANGAYVQLGGQNLTGNKAPNSPTFTASLGADYNLQTSIGDFKFNANWYHNDGFFTEADNLLAQPSYNMVGLSLRYQPKNSAFYARIWGKNLLNERVSTQINVTPLGAAVGYQPPRTAGLTVGFDF